MREPDWELSVTTAPASEPLTLDDVRGSLRLDATGSPVSHADDDLLTRYIADVRMQAEHETNRALVTTAFLMRMSGWPCCRAFRLPRPPLQADSVVVSYYDESGVLQTFDDALYEVHAPAGPFAQPGSIELAPDAAWPSLQSRRWPVQVAFSGGYGDAGSDVPGGIRDWMLVQIGSLYANREGVLVGDSAVDLTFVNRIVSRYHVHWAF